MARLNLSVAVGGYNRNRPLFSGATAIDGVDPVFMTLSPEEITGSLVFVPGPVSTTSAAQMSVGLFDRKGGSELLNIQPGPYQLPRMSPDGTLRKDRRMNIRIPRKDLGAILSAHSGNN